MSTQPTLGFSAHNTEEPLQGMDLQEKDGQHTESWLERSQI